MKYIDMAMLPVHLGFATSQRDFEKEMKRLGVTEIYQSKAQASTVVFEKPEQNDLIIVVYRGGEQPNHKLYSLLAHECIHAWEYIKKAMSTSQDHEEFKAYTIQYMLGAMITHLESENAQKIARKR